MTQKKNLASLTVLTLLTLGTIAPLGAQKSFTVQKDITVAAGEVQDNVIAFGGNVVVEGRVKESVVAIGGTILVSGEVGDAVVGIGSRITLKPSAIVNGDVVSLGGILEKEPGCIIRGDTVYFKPSEIGGRLFRGGLFKGIFALPLFPIFFIIKLIGVFLMLLVTLVVAGLFPRQIVRASGEVRASFWPVFGTGLLAIIIFAGAVIFSALLCFVLIGIPILIALIWAGFAIKLFGRVVLLFFFGESLLKAFGAKNVSAIGASLTGLVLVSLIGFIPFVGFLFSAVLNIIGWGVVIRTKFGTTENWFRKK
jgi:hypothetical protein